MGPFGVVYYLFAPGWRTGLSSALWLTIAVSLVIYAGLAARARAAARASALLLPIYYHSITNLLPVA